MRKDVRIGLAIGGVLLAVLIVYLLVPKENTGNANKAQASAQGGGGAPTGGLGGDNSGATGASGTDAGQAPASPNSPNHDTTTPTTRRDDPSFASGGTTGTDPGNGAAGTTGGADASAQAETAGGGNADWASILNNGVMPESLMATRSGNDPFSDPAKGNTAGGTSGHGARTAVGTPQDKIDWGVTPGGAAGSGSTGTPAPAAGTSGSTSGTTVANTPTAPTVTASAGLKEHKMAQGETFSSIAVSLYGDAKYAKEIVKANPTLEPSRIRAGTVVKLPDMATIRASQNSPAGAPGAHAVAAGASAKAEPAIDPSKEYRVQSNDSLHKIALKLYGKSDKADAIYDANKEKIGGDPHRIKVGMVLKLPEPPSHSPTATR